MTSTINAVIIIFPVALLSFLIVYVRAEFIIEPEKIVELGPKQAAQEDAQGFAILAIMFGIITTITFKVLYRYFSEVASQLFLILGISCAIILSLLAMKLRPAANLKGVPEVTLLNFVWGIGYGWLLPIILKSDFEIRKLTN